MAHRSWRTFCGSSPTRPEPRCGRRDKLNLPRHCRRYLVRAETRDKRFDKSIDLRAGEARSLDIAAD